MTGKRRMGDEPPRPPKPTSFNPPPPPQLVITPAPSRREARAIRKKQARKRIGFAGGAAILAAIALVAALAIFVVPKAVSSGGGPKRAQTTLLVQIEGTNRTASASALLAHDTTPTPHQGVEVLIPGRVITDICGFGSQDFANVLALPGGVTASQQALSAMLGDITIDGSWVLTEADFTRLIDKLGGITVDSVDTNVVRRTSGGGGTVLVAAGPNKQLNGTQAVEYATYVASAHEDASAQLLRLQNVIDGMLQALPRSPTAIAALLRTLGPSGESTLGVSKLADLLAGLAADYNASSSFYPTDLPTTPIDSGGAPSYRIDNTSDTGAKALVSGHLQHSVPAGGDKPKPTVLLLNGIGTPGLVSTACPKLAAHGLAYAGSNNAPSFSNALSIIALSSDSQVALGDKVAKALGLPTSDIELDRSPQNVANVIVTLGRDYRH